MYDVSVKSLLPGLYSSLDKLIESGRFQNRNVYVFGKAIWGFAVVQYLNEKGISVKGVLDNNSNKRCWGDSVRLSVIADENLVTNFFYPEEALGKYDENAFVLVSSKHYVAQSKQLEGMGYKENINFVKLDRSEAVNIDGKQELLDSDQIKGQLYEILKFLKKICEENGLTYYLTEGTLLGAVRHKGFIPWDDDIDVSMPIKDYFKLHEIFRQYDYTYGKYSLYSMVDDRNCMYAYAKLVNTDWKLHLEKYPMDVITHISIDIFPISGAPLPGEKESERFLKDLNSFNSKWMKYRSYFGMGVYNFDDCREQWYELLTRYDYESSSGLSYIFAEGRNFRVCDRKLYSSKVELLFEDEMFTTISGYKEYLTIAYGDYMTPPENWKRMGKHSYLECWKKEN